MNHRPSTHAHIADEERGLNVVRPTSLASIAAPYNGSTRGAQPLLPDHGLHARFPSVSPRLQAHPLSNREPYEHVRGVHGIEVKQPPGGLVSALDPTLRRIHGTWVAWGSGSADRETSDEAGRVRVPPGEESYTLRRVWLEDSEVEAYYHGFANRSLWPLCHMLVHYFEYRTEFWDRYRAVNLRFAHAVADEAQRHTGRIMAWIQDYHERGVLLLSRFAGAAEEIEGAVLINPFNVDGFVSAIRLALDMPAEERRRRMRRMRRWLQNNTIFDWLDAILARSADIMQSQPPAPSAWAAG